MAEEFGGGGAVESAQTPQTNTVSTSQANVDGVGGSQTSSYESTDINTSASSENRSTGLQTSDSGNREILATGKNQEGTLGFTLTKGADGKNHLQANFTEKLEHDDDNGGMFGSNDDLSQNRYRNQPNITRTAERVEGQFNQQLPKYSLDEFSNAIASGRVDGSRVPQEYQQQYADWKIGQAMQNFNQNKRAAEELDARRRAQIQAQMNPEAQRVQLQEFLGNLDSEADLRAKEDSGMTAEDIENIDLMDDDDPKLINYKLSKEWHKQDLMQRMQSRYQGELAYQQHQENVYRGIRQFADQARATEANFEAIDVLMASRVNDLPYKQAQVIVPVLQALASGTITDAQTETLRRYYEDTRKVFYAQKNGLGRSPRAVNRPPSVERAGDGSYIGDVYRPNYQALAKADVRGRRAWLAEYIRNRNQ